MYIEDIRQQIYNKWVNTEQQAVHILQPVDANAKQTASQAPNAGTISSYVSFGKFSQALGTNPSTDFRAGAISEKAPL